MSIPPVLRPEDGRVVRVEIAKGHDLFDRAQGADCERFLLAVAADESLNGVHVVSEHVLGRLLGTPTVVLTRPHHSLALVDRVAPPGGSLSSKDHNSGGGGRKRHLPDRAAEGLTGLPK